jgi:hypothetical protein
LVEFLQYFKTKKQEEISSLPAFVMVFYSCELNGVHFTVLVVPKSFSFARFIDPSEARSQVAFSCGRRGTCLRSKRWMRRKFHLRTPHPSADKRLPPSPTGEGLPFIALSMKQSLVPTAASRARPENEKFEAQPPKKCKKK